MTDRSKWVTLIDLYNHEVGTVAPEIIALLVSTGLISTLDQDRLRVPLPFSKTDFFGESAKEEIEKLNPDNLVLLDRQPLGSSQPPLPDRAYTSLNDWLMAVHEIKAAGHDIVCFTAPKERMAVVIDHTANMTYSLPLRHLYAANPNLLLSTVTAWGFENDSAELIRQLRDHNLREYLISGKPSYLSEERTVDAQPEPELEALWKDDADLIIAAFNAHTEATKALDPREGR